MRCSSCFRAGVPSLNPERLRMALLSLHNRNTLYQIFLFLNELSGRTGFRKTQLRCVCA
uniref:Uncharacterized protein n=1 Tax=Anguilla anguilla TaxID=7936 RepID=A0A0E9RGF9_ANGAN